MDNDFPVQFIFAGKAHPNDGAGKDMIKELVHFARTPEIRNRIVFLENYDMTIAKYMVSGSDIWLNTPRRPQEASGTSGMKAAINGSLNVSILDGWWDEGYSPDSGWAIGQGENYYDAQKQDDIESKALYNLLENDIIPLFYSRGRDGLPRQWIRKMKASISNIGIDFSSHRMVMEYAEKYYKPTLVKTGEYEKQGFIQGKEGAAFLARIRDEWDKVKIELDRAKADSSISTGDTRSIVAQVYLGNLEPRDVRVELYYGEVSARDEVTNPAGQEMKAAKKAGEYYSYTADLIFNKGGRQGYTVRISPKYPHNDKAYIRGYIKWGRIK